ncbi:hypothetical protein E2320_018862 [Naja naja]|nr:hypothetical protein E2320_018862 [Naja naja]
MVPGQQKNERKLDWKKMIVGTHETSSRDAYIQTTQTRKTLSKLTEQTERHQRSGIIYWIQYSNCEKNYVGQTGRKLPTRLHEHFLAIKRQDPLSHMSVHKDSKGHKFDLTITTVVTQAKTNREREVPEACFSTKKSINKHIDPIYQPLRMKEQHQPRCCKQSWWEEKETRGPGKEGGKGRRREDSSDARSHPPLLEGGSWLSSPGKGPRRKNWGLPNGLHPHPTQPRRVSLPFVTGRVGADCLFQPLLSLVNAGAFGTPEVILEDGLEEGWLVSSKWAFLPVNAVQSASFSEPCKSVRLKPKILLHYLLLIYSIIFNSILFFILKMTLHKAVMYCLDRASRDNGFIWNFLNMRLSSPEQQRDYISKMKPASRKNPFMSTFSAIQVTQADKQAHESESIPTILFLTKCSFQAARLIPKFTSEHVEKFDQVRTLITKVISPIEVCCSEQHRNISLKIQEKKLTYLSQSSMLYKVIFYPIRDDSNQKMKYPQKVCYQNVFKKNTEYFIQLLVYDIRLYFFMDSQSPDEKSIRLRLITQDEECVSQNAKLGLAYFLISTAPDNPAEPHPAVECWSLTNMPDPQVPENNKDSNSFVHSFSLFPLSKPIGSREYSKQMCSILCVGCYQGTRFSRATAVLWLVKLFARIFCNPDATWKLNVYQDMSFPPLYRVVGILGTQQQEVTFISFPKLNEEHIARHFNVTAQCNQGKDDLPNLSSLESIAANTLTITCKCFNPVITDLNSNKLQSCLFRDSPSKLTAPQPERYSVLSELYCSFKFSLVQKDFCTLAQAMKHAQLSLDCTQISTMMMEAKDLTQGVNADFSRKPVSPINSVGITLHKDLIDLKPRVTFCRYLIGFFVDFDPAGLIPYYINIYDAGKMQLTADHSELTFPILTKEHCGQKEDVLKRLPFLKKNKAQTLEPLKQLILTFSVGRKHGKEKMDCYIKEIRMKCYLVRKKCLTALLETASTFVKKLHQKEDRDRIKKYQVMNISRDGFFKQATPYFFKASGKWQSPARDNIVMLHSSQQGTENIQNDLDFPAIQDMLALLKRNLKDLILGYTKDSDDESLRIGFRDQEALSSFLNSLETIPTTTRYSNQEEKKGRKSSLPLPTLVSVLLYKKNAIIQGALGKRNTGWNFPFPFVVLLALSHADDNLLAHMQSFIPKLHILLVEMNTGEACEAFLIQHIFCPVCDICSVSAVLKGYLLQQHTGKHAKCTFEDEPQRLSQMLNTKEEGHPSILQSRDFSQEVFGRSFYNKNKNNYFKIFRREIDGATKCITISIEPFLIWSFMIERINRVFFKPDKYSCSSFEKSIKLALHYPIGSHSMRDEIGIPLRSNYPQLALIMVSDIIFVFMSWNKENSNITALDLQLIFITLQFQQDLSKGAKRFNIMFLIKHKNGKFSKLDFVNMVKKGTISDWETEKTASRQVRTAVTVFRRQLQDSSNSALQDSSNPAQQSQQAANSKQPSSHQQRPTQRPPSIFREGSTAARSPC